MFKLLLCISLSRVRCKQDQSIALLANLYCQFEQVGNFYTCLGADLNFRSILKVELQERDWLAFSLSQVDLTSLFFVLVFRDFVFADVSQTGSSPNQIPGIYLVLHLVHPVLFCQ